ncbi:MAG: hypothetical protein FWG61_04345 [Firmicutes bacterium]|nr:hypothetical protein [Bacillota bacterium]
MVRRAKLFKSILSLLFVFALMITLVPPAFAMSPENDSQGWHDTDVDYDLISGYAIFDFENDVVFLFFFISDYDTHWEHYLGIYGDNPVKWNEREPDDRDPLGLSLFTYKPDIIVIMQSSNPYVYCINNPLLYIDPSGNDIGENFKNGIEFMQQIYQQYSGFIKNTQTYIHNGLWSSNT